MQSLSSPNLCKTRRHTINLKETQRGIKYRKEIEASENSGQHVIYLTTTGIAVMECNSCGSHHIVDFNICSSPICSSCSSVNPLPYGEFIYLQCAGTFSAISEDFSVEADSRRRLCSLITEHMSEKSNYSTLHREIDSIISSMKGQLLFTEDLELGELQKPATQYLQGLFKKGVLERFDTGIYFLAGERHSEEEILSAKFFRRKRKYVGVPSHMTLIEWIKTGSFSCKEAVFTVTRHTNSTERMAWRKTGSMRTKIFFTELVIQESDWKMIAAIMTLRHMDWVDSLQSRDRSKLRSWCKTAITEQEIDNFWQKHKTFSKKRVLSFLKEGQNGKAHK